MVVLILYSQGCFQLRLDLDSVVQDDEPRAFTVVDATRSRSKSPHEFGRCPGTGNQTAGARRDGDESVTYASVLTIRQRCAIPDWQQYTPKRRGETDLADGSLSRSPLRAASAKV